MTTSKKVTLATIKSFIRNNDGKLFIKIGSKFDGMTDCIEQINESFKPVEDDRGYCPKHTLGIEGAWFVGQSRDYFTQYKQYGFEGFQVYNACGSFILAIKQA